VGIDTIINAVQSLVADWGIIAIVEAGAIEDVTDLRSLASLHRRTLVSDGGPGQEATRST
jgi:hypothetical protein